MMPCGSAVCSRGPLSSRLAGPPLLDSSALPPVTEGGATAQPSAQRAAPPPPARCLLLAMFAPSPPHFSDPLSEFQRFSSLHCPLNLLASHMQPPFAWDHHAAPPPVIHDAAVAAAVAAGQWRRAGSVGARQSRPAPHAWSAARAGGTRPAAVRMMECHGAPLAGDPRGDAGPKPHATHPSAGRCNRWRKPSQSVPHTRSCTFTKSPSSGRPGGPRPPPPHLRTAPTPPSGRAWAAQPVPVSPGA